MLVIDRQALYLPSSRVWFLTLREENLEDWLEEARVEVQRDMYQTEGCILGEMKSQSRPIGPTTQEHSRSLTVSATHRGRPAGRPGRAVDPASSAVGRRHRHALTRRRMRACEDLTSTTWLPCDYDLLTEYDEAPTRKDICAFIVLFQVAWESGCLESSHSSKHPPLPHCKSRRLNHG